MIFGTALPSCRVTSTFVGFKSRVNHALLVGVLDSLAHLPEQREAFFEPETVLVAVVRDRIAAHVLHHEVRTAIIGDPAVVYARDARVLHQRERLALGLEPDDDLRTVHPPLDHLQRHAAAHRLLLLGEVDRAHPAFAENVEDAVGADALGSLGRRWRSLLLQIAWASRCLRRGVPRTARASPRRFLAAGRRTRSVPRRARRVRRSTPIRVCPAPRATRPPAGPAGSGLEGSGRQPRRRSLLELDAQCVRQVCDEARGLRRGH